MGVRKRIASIVAKVFLLAGVFPLSAGLVAMAVLAHTGELATFWRTITLATGVGGALVAAAIILDRWACRQGAAGRRGFEVVVNRLPADRSDDPSHPSGA